MKRYALFSGARYYPGGGWNDFQGTFDDAALAEKAGERSMEPYLMDWWQVVDLETGLVLKKGYADDDD